MLAGWKCPQARSNSSIHFRFRVWTQPDTRSSLRLDCSRKASSAPPPMARASVTRSAPGSKKHTPIVKTTRAVFNPFVKALASRSSSTLLYQAKPPFLHIGLNAVLSGVCFLYTGFNVYAVLLNPLSNIDMWISAAVGGLCVAMTFIGLRFASGVLLQTPLTRQTLS